MNDNTKILIVIGLWAFFILCLAYAKPPEFYNHIDTCDIVKEQKCIERNMTYDRFVGCYDPIEYRIIELDINCRLVDLEYKKMIERDDIK